MPGSWWWFVTAIFFGFGILFCLISAGIFWSLGRAVTPVLTETQHQLQDLGDLAANTVGRAADTVDIVELRVSQAMGQAVQAGGTVRQQALGVGAVLAGVFVAVRIARSLRKPSHRRRRR